MDVRTEEKKLWSEVWRNDESTAESMKSESLSGRKRQERSMNLYEDLTVDQLRSNLCSKSNVNYCSSFNDCSLWTLSFNACISWSVFVRVIVARFRDWFHGILTVESKWFTSLQRSSYEFSGSKFWLDYKSTMNESWLVFQIDKFALYLFFLIPSNFLCLL